jgi:hypothetical protein
MKNLIWLLLLVLAGSGCKTHSRSAQAQIQQAIAAQQQALAQWQQEPSVLVRGEVKNPIVGWSEGLTLARAIVAAEYRGPWDPHQILIIRKGETFRINPKHLLWKTEDPLLEPGDIIQIER